MIRCVLCGCSRFDAQGAGCARCGGSPASRSEAVHVNADTKAKLLKHADDLEGFGVTVKQGFGATIERRGGLRKGDLGLITIHKGDIALFLAVAESLHPHMLRDLVVFLWKRLHIPEEEIIRLRLEEPERISEQLHGSAPHTQRKTRRSAGRKRASKGSKKPLS